MHKQPWSTCRGVDSSLFCIILVGSFVAAAPQQLHCTETWLSRRPDVGCRRAGESVAKYIRQASPYNTQIVALGIDTYLKMLLHDNFVVSPLDAVPQCEVSIASNRQCTHKVQCTLSSEYLCHVR